MAWTLFKTRTKTIDEVMAAFSRNFVGTIVRGQKVSGVEITVDDIDGCGRRYFAHVMFEENPVGTTDPEEALRRRLYSDIPRSADVLCYSWNELVAVVSGKLKRVWTLDDESRQ